MVAARISTPSLLDVDAVQLGQELVDEVPARRVPHVGAARAERIDLVEEQHARLVAPGLLEQLVQVLLAVADPHVEHVVDADGERKPALTSPAVARARYVLPQPGGPYMRMPPPIVLP